MNSTIQRQCLHQQTNHQKWSRRSKFQLFTNLIYTYCVLLMLINQTTTTYTNTFIDHKGLLTPKQLITNTLKQIKPKFNPRFVSSDKKTKLNVYDLGAGDVKSIRKHQPVSKEQMPQGTYYYTDYKAPVLKNLIPMSPNCPETGRTVCKDAKAYPVDSILSLILEAKANKFNFSSLFVDESQNSDMPNLPELESIIAKSCSGDEKVPEQYENESEDNHKAKNSKTNEKERKTNYENVKTHYRRPGDSAVSYDNNENYDENYLQNQQANSKTYQNPTPNSNNHDNGDRYEQQRIMNNNESLYDGKSVEVETTKSYDNQVDNKSTQFQMNQPPVEQQQYNQQKTNYPVINHQQVHHQQVNHQQVNHQQVNHQQITQQPMQPEQQIYQQPQSSIKFEQQYQQNKLMNRQPVLKYRHINQNGYYQTRKNGRKPYQTTVTIIPFIQYIAQQLPSNDYQLSTDKQLLDTISQSLRHTPLNRLSPDAWLPIKAYTTTDIQQREIDDHLSTDQLHVAADQLSNDELAPSEYAPNYSSNYRDKRSTCDKTEQQVSTNTGDKDETSSITRVKKQAGFDEEPEELCQTKRLYITPKAALNDKSEWRYIVNVGERDARLKQVIKVDVCASPNGPCSSQISLPFGYVSKCKQKYIKKKLLAIDPDGQSTSTESFFIPSCCVCEIVRMNRK